MNDIRITTNPFERSKNPTAKQIAEQLGISPGYLRSVFRGERRPSIKLARQIMSLPGLEGLSWDDIYGPARHNQGEAQ